ncbi:Ig-like domain-containing protein [Nocardioides sp.]|uniref:Ig-like domain-containing protein n=1 Tax=Nocardioides sp. TaxID=35761 RepID=UPI002BDBCD08|nr:hypothetical protein [Nocardioides sp.]HXH76924.1 hypothetical protein [Nocardioides sp.]
MPLRAQRFAVLTTAAAVVTTMLSLGTFVPAMADDSPPPVAVGESVAVEGVGDEFGGVSFIDVLANDSGAAGEILEICRVQAPERGLSVAEVQPDGDFTIETPNSGLSSGGRPLEEGARERIAVLPWANRAGTYQFTYWACDSKHLTPATVTVTVTESPEVAVRKAARPGWLRFTNPRTGPAIVIYGGLRADEPTGRVRLAPDSSATRRVDLRTIRWMAFSPRTGYPLGDGVVRGIRLPGSTSRSALASDRIQPRLTAGMLRAWRSS